MDRLQSYESQPTSPCDTPALSRTASLAAGRNDTDRPLASSSDADESTPLYQHDTAEYGSTSRTAAPPRSEHGGMQRSTVAGAGQDIFAGGHHRHEERGTHAGHHGSAKAWRGWFGLNEDGDGHSHDEDAGRSERRKAHREEVQSNGHAPNGSAREQRHNGHVHSHGHVHMDMERWSPDGIEGEVDGAKVGMRRQVVSILVSSGLSTGRACD